MATIGGEQASRRRSGHRRLRRVRQLWDLLHLLHDWGQVPLVAATVDHGLRAEAADEADSGDAPSAKASRIPHATLALAGLGWSRAICRIRRVRTRYSLLADWAKGRRLHRRHPWPHDGRSGRDVPHAPRARRRDRRSDGHGEPHLAPRSAVRPAACLAYGVRKSATTFPTKRASTGSKTPRTKMKVSTG